MKIREILEGSNWDTFKKGVKTGYDRTEKLKKTVKYHPVTKTIQKIAKFAKDISKRPT